jgi:hypothetical protein
MSEDFQVLGFFDSLNEGMQATAYSVRCPPRLMPGVRRAEDLLRDPGPTPAITPDP